MIVAVLFEVVAFVPELVSPTKTVQLKVVLRFETAVKLKSGVLSAVKELLAGDVGLKAVIVPPTRPTNRPIATRKAAYLNGLDTSDISQSGYL